MIPCAIFVLDLFFNVISAFLPFIEKFQIMDIPLSSAGAILDHKIVSITLHNTIFNNS